MSISDFFHKRITIKFFVYVIYLVLLISGLYHHEMWRDEYEEFLQSRDADGLFGLEKSMSLGHAMLWQSCLWVITRFTHNPAAMQIFHGLIAACFAFVLLFKSPFKLWQSSLLLLSYFFIFEYAVISRCYAFGVLFFMLFATNYLKHQKLNVFICLILFLLANTSIYAMMLTALLVVWLFFNEMLKKEASWSTKIRKYLPILFVVCIGIFIAYLQIRPQPGNSFPMHKVLWPFDQSRFELSITQFFSAFVPIVNFKNPFLWNTNFLMNTDGIVNWIWPLIVFILVSFPLIRKKSIFILWIAGVGLILLFQYHTGFRFARYYGHFFLWWLLCIWISSKFKETIIWRHRIANYVFMFVIFVQAIGGITMLATDFNIKFSRGAEAAFWLSKNGYAESYIIGTYDFTMSPIAAELERKIYLIEQKSIGSFTKWDKLRMSTIDTSSLLEALNTAPKNDSFIFITSHPLPEFEYFKLLEQSKALPNHFIFRNFHFTPLAYFKPGIEKFEEYWIFKTVEISMAQDLKRDD